VCLTLWAYLNFLCVVSLCVAVRQLQLEEAGRREEEERRSSAAAGGGSRKKKKGKVRNPVLPWIWKYDGKTRLLDNCLCRKSV
jgi:hypothetical protein